MKVLWFALAGIALTIFFSQRDLALMNGSYAIGGAVGSLIGATILWAVIAGIRSVFRSQR